MASLCLSTDGPSGYALISNLLLVFDSRLAETGEANGLISVNTAAATTSCGAFGLCVGSSLTGDAVSFVAGCFAAKSDRAVHSIGPLRRDLRNACRIPDVTPAGDPGNGDVSVKTKIPMSQRSILAEARLSDIGSLYGKERRDIHQRLGDRTVEQEGSRRSCKYNPAPAA